MIGALHRQMSHYQPDSELSRFNRAPAPTPVKISPEFARVVRFTLDLCRRSHGALDPTVNAHHRCASKESDQTP